MSLFRACLVLQLAAVAVHATSSVTFKEGLEGQTCFMQPFTFPSNSFAYKIIVIRPTKLAGDCTEDQIRISPLYVGGACLAPRDNDLTGCPPGVENPRQITGPASASGVTERLNATGVLCTDVFARGESKVMKDVVHFDSGVVDCGPSKYGFFFIENACPAGQGESVVTAILEYVDRPETVCEAVGGASAWGRWPLALGAVILIAAAVFGVAAVMGRRRAAAAGVGVQMGAPMPGNSVPYVPVHHPAPEGVAGAGARRQVAGGQAPTWYAGNKKESV